MLSQSSVRSAGGSAKYFAADNYYTSADATAASEWVGIGAGTLGLKGAPTQEDFKAVLEGKLPDGTQLSAGANGNRNYGSDFTFSASKSVSLFALVAGDKRIVELHQQAVKDTMAWAERNLAFARVAGPDGKIQSVKTGNLVAGMFLHDTNREQEPQLHTHVVITNATQGPDGKWRALDNRQLWAANTLLGAQYNAIMRTGLAKLGYTHELVGKHGSFEITGIGRDIIMAFSTRREQILAALEGKRSTPEQRNAITRMTREDKAEVEDRGALYASWRERARDLGTDLSAMVATSYENAARAEAPWTRAIEGLKSIGAQARAIGAYFAEKLGMDRSDELRPRINIRATPEQIATNQAVASAIRHLSEREAAFTDHDVARAALNLDLPGVRLETIEPVIEQMKGAGLIVPGDEKHAAYMTTAQSLQTERQILEEAWKGQGTRTPIMSAEDAKVQLQEKAIELFGFNLNPGQEAAGVAVLASGDRTMLIQGVAGAGKTTALQPLGEVLKENGKELRGLAFAGAMVKLLRDANIPAQTVDSFLGRYRRILEPNPNPAWVDRARDELKDTVFVIDEASMTSNVNQLALNRLFNILDVPKPDMGDTAQLAAIAAGKPFEIMQRAGVTTAQMPENLRATSDTMKRVVKHLYANRPDAAMAVLAPYTVIAPDNIAGTAVDRWLALSPDQRAQTGIYADGRALKEEGNRLVQEGLTKEGAIGRELGTVPIYDRENVTTEQLRHVSTYRLGQILAVSAQIKSARLHPGEYHVAAVDRETGNVTLENERGRQFAFQPGRLRPEMREAVKPRIEIFTARDIKLHEGDRIRWNAKDEARDMHRADKAKVLGLDAKGVTVELANGLTVTLAHNDPMLRRMDLAYVQNVHQLQGATDRDAIAMADSRNVKLTTMRAFLVLATRVRESITFVMDDRDRYLRLIKEQPGDKTSSLETTGELPGRDPIDTSGTPGGGGSGAAKGASSPRAPMPEWDADKAAAFFDGLSSETPAVATTPAKAPEPTPGATKPSDGLQEAARTPTERASPNRPGNVAAQPESAKPELEKKIEEGGGRGRQIEFDL